VLFVGDDWAEDHHDVELMDTSGRRLGKARLAEGVAGIARLHAMIGEYLGEDAGAVEVKIGIETDRGPWVAALAAAGYVVYGINPLQVARYRERHSVSGAKSDAADAHTLADMVRADSHQLRPVAADSAEAEAVKVISRAHKTLMRNFRFRVPGWGELDWPSIITELHLVGYKGVVAVEHEDPTMGRIEGARRGLEFLVRQPPFAS
jgi:transposase